MTMSVINFRLIGVLVFFVFIILFEMTNSKCLQDEDWVFDEDYDIKVLMNKFWKEMRKKLEDQKNKQDMMDASLQSIKQTVEDLSVDCQQCSRKDPEDIIQNSFATAECEERSHKCSEMATCIVGHYECSCLPGYSGDGFTCQDIDECASGVHECHTHATCTNVPGSYSCQCRPPYAGDGRTCDNVCEHPSLYNTELGCITLVSSKGTFNAADGLGGALPWDEAVALCQEVTGRRILEDITVEHIQLIQQHFSPMVLYPYAWIGVKHSKWISSGLTVDSNLWKDGQPNGVGEQCGDLDLTLPPGLEDDACSRSQYVLCQLRH